MIELCFPGADDLRLSKKEAVGGCRVCLRSKFTPTAALSEPPCHEACEPHAYLSPPHAVQTTPAAAEAASTNRHLP